MPPVFNPYHPRAVPPATAPVQMELSRLAAARRRGVRLISRDGTRLYKLVLGEWQEARWDGSDYGSWWSRPQPPEDGMMI